VARGGRPCPLDARAAWRRGLRTRVLRRGLGGKTVTDPLFDLSGRVAVVTGGLGQLGALYVDGLEERGMKVAVWDVAADDAVDVSDRVAVEAATERVAAEWGVPHLLVNNAAL